MTPTDISYMHVSFCCRLKAMTPTDISYVHVSFCCRIKP